jgi:hypothetical protein
LVFSFFHFLITYPFMAIDTTPSTVATNALQAIPFEALIGGPLDACIKAQALAAKTSWEFINEVGLTIDPDTGEKKAINVTFDYNNNGQMTTLVVPLIILLPIPYLAIDKVTIDFLANISAASSSVSETTSDSALNVDVDATASLSVGPFSLSVTAKAGYSSKQSSKASQNSSYSVEYTMNVHVEGGQADMPAGLATVLNILQGSVASVSPDDMVSVAPPNLAFNKQNTANLQITVKNTQGVLAPGARVTVTLNGAVDPFNPLSAPSNQAPTFANFNVTRGMREEDLPRLQAAGRLHPRVASAYQRIYQDTNRVQARIVPVGTARMATYDIDNPGGTSSPNGANNPTLVTALTDQNGTVNIQLVLTPATYGGSSTVQGSLNIAVEVPIVGGTKTKTETQTVGYTIIPVGIGGGMTFQPTPTGALAFAGAGKDASVSLNVLGASQAIIPNFANPITATLMLNGTGTPDSEFAAIAVTTGTPEGTPTPATATGTVDATGQITFKFTTSANATAGSGTIIFAAAGVQSLRVPFTITAAPPAELPAAE